MTPIYDSRLVLAHDDKPGASVLLMNEAPGPSEAVSGIPSFGQQGANIFHALRKAGIRWAVDHQRFVWPTNGASQQSERHRKKAAFLHSRAQRITCTNAFPRWPKPSLDSNGFCPPSKADVMSLDNIARIKGEVRATHRVVLLCGNYAYLACVGESLPHPATRETTELTTAELQQLNERLHSRFEKGWYMGHTRRWSTRSNEITRTLRLVAQYLGWPIDANAG